MPYLPALWRHRRDWPGRCGGGEREEQARPRAAAPPRTDECFRRHHHGKRNFPPWIWFPRDKCAAHLLLKANIIKIKGCKQIDIYVKKGEMKREGDGRLAMDSHEGGREKIQMLLLVEFINMLVATGYFYCYPLNITRIHLKPDVPCNHIDGRNHERCSHPSLVFCLLHIRHNSARIWSNLSGPSSTSSPSWHWASHPHDRIPLPFWSPFILLSAPQPTSTPLAVLALSPFHHRSPVSKVSLKRFNLKVNCRRQILGFFIRSSTVESRMRHAWLWPKIRRAFLNILFRLLAARVQDDLRAKSDASNITECALLIQVNPFRLVFWSPVMYLFLFYLNDRGHCFWNPYSC